MAERYVHALRFASLNRFYDVAVRLLTRESHFRHSLLEHCRLAPGDRVLDIGCGSGTLALMLKSAHPAAEVHGLDGDAGMLEYARRKCREARQEVALHHANALDMPFEKHTFDWLLSSLFFHHLDRESKSACLAEAAGLLRPGGRMLIADWGRPAGPLQWLLSWPVRILDGLAVTDDNFRGRLPGMIRDAGFTGVKEIEAIRTPAGTLRIWQATAAG